MRIVPAVLVSLLAGCAVGDRIGSPCSSLGGSTCGGMITIDSSDPAVTVFSIDQLDRTAPGQFELMDPDGDPCTYYLGASIWGAEELAVEDLPLRYDETVDNYTPLVEGSWYLAMFRAGDRFSDTSSTNVSEWNAVFKPGEPDSMMRWADLADFCDEPPPSISW